MLSFMFTCVVIVAFIPIAITAVSLIIMLFTSAALAVTKRD